MISNLAWILIFLSVCGIVVSSPDRAVDCRKFVFAPLCRGVAAKRDSQGPGNYDPTALLEETYGKKSTGNIFNPFATGGDHSQPAFDARMQHLLRYLYSALGFLAPDENDNLVGTPRSKESEIEKSFQGRMNSLLKLLYESRNNAERDYSSASEYENSLSLPSVLRLSRN